MKVKQIHRYCQYIYIDHIEILNLSRQNLNGDSVPTELYRLNLTRLLVFNTKNLITIRSNIKINFPCEVSKTHRFPIFTSEYSDGIC